MPALVAGSNARCSGSLGWTSGRGGMTVNDLVAPRYARPFGSLGSTGADLVAASSRRGFGFVGFDGVA
jgi:hypothetical protein